MLLTDGRWTGRGRYLFHGQSLGIGVQTQFRVTSDDHGLHVEGSLDAQQQPSREFALRVVPDDTGLFEMTAQGFGPALQGTAKLASEPNMGMLWADAVDRQVSFSVFAVPDGYGCRGFARDESGLITWELSLRLEGAQTGRGPSPNKTNVVSLRPRRS